MFHKIKNVTPLDNYILNVQFSEGITKRYNVKPLFKRFDVFNGLKDGQLFEKVHVGPGGYGVVWNDEIDLSCDELYDNGNTI